MVRRLYEPSRHYVLLPCDCKRAMDAPQVQGKQW
jgi:hypothetical protein